MDDNDKMPISISGVPYKLVKQLDEIAKKHHRSRSAEIILILEAWVDKPDFPPTKP